MVAYSFAPRFEVPIRQGWKTQTIRQGRKRHARPGEMLQLFCGMRTQHCRRIVADVQCLYVMPLRIDFDASGLIIAIQNDWALVPDLEAFAISDGFIGIDDMSVFWGRAHGQMNRFDGVLIVWATPMERPDLAPTPQPELPDFLRSQSNRERA